MNETFYLQHHGIQGQKWYRRRYQNEDGSLTPAGRVHYGVGDPREKSSIGEAARHFGKRTVAAISSARAKSKEKAKERAEQKAIEKIKNAEKERERILKSGDSKEVLDHQSEFTSEELQDALTRINKVNQLSREASMQLAEERKNTRANKIIDKWSARIDTGLKLVGTIEKVKSGIDKVKSWKEDKFEGMSVDDIFKELPNMSTGRLKAARERVGAFKEISNAVNDIFKANDTINNSKNDTEINAWLRDSTMSEIVREIPKMSPYMATKAKEYVNTQKDLLSFSKAIKDMSDSKKDRYDFTGKTVSEIAKDMRYMNPEDRKIAAGYAKLMDTAYKGIKSEDAYYKERSRRIEEAKAKVESERKEREAKAAAERKEREAKAEAERKEREAKSEAARKEREAKAEAERKRLEAERLRKITEATAKAEAERKEREAKEAKRLKEALEKHSKKLNSSKTYKKALAEVEEYRSKKLSDYSSDSEDDIYAVLMSTGVLDREFYD